MSRPPTGHLDLSCARTLAEDRIRDGSYLRKVFGDSRLVGHILQSHVRILREADDLFVIQFPHTAQPTVFPKLNRMAPHRTGASDTVPATIKTSPPATAGVAVPHNPIDDATSAQQVASRLSLPLLIVIDDHLGWQNNPKGGCLGVDRLARLRGHRRRGSRTQGAQRLWLVGIGDLVRTPRPDNGLGHAGKPPQSRITADPEWRLPEVPQLCRTDQSRSHQVPVLRLDPLGQHP